MALSNDQIVTLIAVERSTASISMFASMLIVITFILFKEFRSLSHTMIFMATPANVLAGVASVIGGDGLNNVKGSTCQAQAFLLQWFMQSDPLWSMVAAITVLLVFFFRWSAEKIKRLYWVYILICYGFPGIIAVFCLAWRSTGPVFGNAVLWCWINQEHKWTRIYTYYGPIWFAIVSSLIVYLIVGIKVYRSRSQLSYFNREPPPDPQESLQMSIRTDCLIEVSWSKAEPIATSTSDARPFPPPTVEAPLVNRKAKGCIDFIICLCLLIYEHVKKLYLVLSGPIRRGFKKWADMDEIKYGYTKCVALFTIAVLITWVPSSANRVYGIIYPGGKYAYALNLASAVVLPMQGFWNCIIFFSTSISNVRKVAQRMRQSHGNSWVGKMLGWSQKDDEIELNTLGRSSQNENGCAQFPRDASTHDCPTDVRSESAADNVTFDATTLDATSQTTASTKETDVDKLSSNFSVTHYEATSSDAGTAHDEDDAGTHEAERDGVRKSEVWCDIGTAH